MSDYKIKIDKQLLINNRTFREGYEIGFELKNDMGTYSRIIGQIQSINENDETLTLTRLEVDRHNVDGDMVVKIADMIDVNYVYYD